MLVLQRLRHWPRLDLLRRRDGLRMALEICLRPAFTAGISIYGTKRSCNATDVGGNCLRALTQLSRTLKCGGACNAIYIRQRQRSATCLKAADLIFNEECVNIVRLFYHQPPDQRRLSNLCHLDRNVDQRTNDVAHCASWLAWVTGRSECWLHLRKPPKTMPSGLDLLVNRSHVSECDLR